MRMRAKIAHPPSLERVAHCVEKMGQQLCLLKMTNESWQYIVIADADSGVQVWAKLPTQAFLAEYQISSMNRDEIYLELNPDNLYRAIRSTKGSLECGVRLYKPQEGPPVLEFRIVHQSRTGIRQELMQTVPVRILTPQEMEPLHEPQISEPLVYVMMPPLPVVRAYVDKMRSISDQICIGASMRGQFSLHSALDGADMQTHWNGLINPEIDRSGSQSSTTSMSTLSRNGDDLIEARVRTKDLINFLYSYYVEPVRVVCCIIPDFAVIFYVYMGRNNSEHGSLTYYIPIRLL
ncbi:checkpoint protein Hus1/Mec3 [Syncephalis plumigaleata]|nr:checkpoint protein Hus1/Mec3 [Syncephalis plumigaleata]